MRILALDLSNKPGYAFFIDQNLIKAGAYTEPLTLEVPEILKDSPADLFYVYRAQFIADFIEELIALHGPEMIAIEQTNAGSWRNSQKQLEFIHCVLLQALHRRGLHNKIIYIDTSKWRSVLKIRLTNDQKKHNRKVSTGQIRGRITSKHLSVQYVNERFGLKLKLKDNDMADAINIGLCAIEILSKKTEKLDINEALFPKE